MRCAAWLSLLALASCAVPAIPPPVTALAAGPSVCRVGPDGARPIADRGIGGTGVASVQTADRGIGGTGIIGVITGFASVCVAGQEVALPPGLPPQVDGRPGSLDDLRAGQVVAVHAGGPAGALLAREIVVRHVVVGPVQRSSDAILVVAGQMVLVEDATGGARRAALGAFVAVSGLRQPGGMIVATRVDPAPPGPVLLRGELMRIYGAARIGSQSVRLPEGTRIPGGFPVVVTGAMQGDVLVADSVARDLADESPSAYFGPTVSNFVVEGYLAVVAGGYFVSRDFVRGGDVGAGQHGRSIANFDRRPEGGLVARGQRAEGAAGFPGGGFSPAPVPRGGMGSPQGVGGHGGPGSYGGQGGFGRQGAPPPRFPAGDAAGQGGTMPSGPSPQRR